MSHIWSKYFVVLWGNQNCLTAQILFLLVRIVHKILLLTSSDFIDVSILNLSLSLCSGNVYLLAVFKVKR